jgi:hypothetical protein
VADDRWSGAERGLKADAATGGGATGASRACSRRNRPESRFTTYDQAQLDSASRNKRLRGLHRDP